ncbi:L,D-transpeptidase [Amycolatopsis jiangsuensis]|uniref:L,D-TPase catalytic domain-containing protein n=1 Tax=Amycolatopsis jiangsuensis TaxID=1181879 RepID=A0A840IP93_9PSEU|nr:L,D-transpeptidase [Amycolatopsis jiangsuensis]MBB4683265.1 hypothetical protein [Amycolatopsis jiangsuensis]
MRARFCAVLAVAGTVATACAAPAPEGAPVPVAGKSGLPAVPGRAGSPTMAGQADSPTVAGQAGEPGAPGRGGEPEMSGWAGDPRMSGRGGRPGMGGASGRPPAPMITAPVVPLRPEPPCTVVTGACASLSLRLAWLVRGGAVVRGPVEMEPGDAGQPTPVGGFRVVWKDKVHRSSEYGDDMPDAVFFAPGGIAFHAGPLNHPSHGCIHLAPKDATAFFDALPVGAQVEVRA